MVVSLVVTAGCLGAIGPSGEGTPTPAATPTATATTGGTASNVVTPPLNVSALRAAHAQQLRSAGAFTVYGRTNYTNLDNGLSQVTRTVGRYDLGSGAALVTEEPSVGDRTTRYRSPDGKTYSRVGGRYHGPERAIAPNATRAIRPGVLEFANLTDLTYRGRATRGNVTGHVYEASGVDSLDRRAFEEENVSVDQLEDYELTLVLSGEGLVKFARFSLVIRADVGRVSVVETRRYAAVGTTTVSPPDWLDAAKRRARKPGPNDVVTREFAVNGSDGRVEVYVTAKKYSLEDGAGALGPTVSENPMYRNEFLDGVRVGEIARIYWLSAEDLRKVRVVFHYDGSEVPGGNESALRVVYNDREEYLFQRLNTTVHAANDTVSATITDPGRLEDLQGNTMLVIHYRQYVEGLRERRGRIAPRE